jgi:hypothetical protein
MNLCIRFRQINLEKRFLIFMKYLIQVPATATATVFLLADSGIYLPPSLTRKGNTGVYR